MPFALNATLATLVVLGIMVLVHEFGHFTMAKFFGVRVEVFSIGFGKRLFGFKRGDTDYRVSLVPLGGYVKMSGEMAGDGTACTTQRTICRQPCAGPGRLHRASPMAAHYHRSGGTVLKFRAGLCADDRPVHDAQRGAGFLLAAGSRGFRSEGFRRRQGRHSGGRKIVRFDTDQNPTWEQVDIRAALDLNSTIPVEVERRREDGPPPSRSKTRKVEDFDSTALGLLPRVQNKPLSVDAVEPGMPAAKAGLKAEDVIASVDGHQFTYVLPCWLTCNRAQADCSTDDPAGKRKPEYHGEADGCRRWHRAQRISARLCGPSSAL